MHDDAAVEDTEFLRTLISLVQQYFNMHKEIVRHSFQWGNKSFIIYLIGQKV